MPVAFLTVGSMAPSPVSAAGSARTPASRAIGWSVETPPNPTTPQGALNGVSCAWGWMCVAVGDSENSGGVKVTLGEIWDGTSWSVTPTPDPPGALSMSSWLTGVSCATPSSCQAVGTYESLYGEDEAFAESWDGTRWSMEVLPQSGAEGTFLSGVSCPAADLCIAVGGYYTDPFESEEAAVAETWNGQTWSISDVPAPTYDSSLSGVSCEAATSCTAVGSSHGNAFAVSLVGTTWSLQAVQDPVGTGDGGTVALDAVSCWEGGCTAVGSYQDSTGSELTLAESSRAGTWYVQATPNSPGYTDNSLSGISCRSTFSCIAVGESSQSLDLVTDPSAMFSESWSGSAWSLTPVPSLAGATSSTLNAASCAAIVAACTIVGSENGPGAQVAVAEVSYGQGRWVPEATPSPLGVEYSGLSALSCVTATWCLAVGSSENPSVTGADPLVEKWDGSSWSILATPLPEGAAGGSLSGVSCTSKESCTAVGSYYNSTGGYALALGWDGSTWTADTVPDPVNTTDTYLSGVSCASAAVCVAVGSSADFTRTLTESWNGTAWTIDTTPALSSDILTASLSKVSCVAADACMAVGSQYDNSGFVSALAENWNGTTWALVPVPDPAFSQSLGIGAISCTAASNCTIVGGYTDSDGTFQPLAESWDGTSWTMEPVSSPRGSIQTGLGGISCAAASSCSAVGSWQAKSSIEDTLVEHWNGTRWSIEPSANVPGSVDQGLVAVSCVGGACTAVGRRYTHGQIWLTLAARTLTAAGVSGEGRAAGP